MRSSRSLKILSTWLTPLLVIALACEPSPVDVPLEIDPQLAKGGNGNGNGKDKGGGGSKCEGLPDGTTALVVLPSPSAVAVGTTLDLAVSSQDGSEVPSCALSWSSSDEALATVSETGVVEGLTVGGPVAISARAKGRGKSLIGTAEVTVVAVWRTLAAENSGPQSMSDNSRAKQAIYLPDHDAVLVIAGYGDYQGGELWRFSLDTREWTQLQADGWPIGKYRDFVHDPVTDELLVPWAGIGEIWAIPVTGGTWTRRAAAPNWESHYIGSFFWDPVRSRLSHLFGYGLGTFRDDYHFFDGTSWVLGTTGGDEVWPRVSAGTITAIDEAGTSVYFSGGSGDANPAQNNPEPGYDDLIRFDLETLSFEYLAPRAHTANVSRGGTALAVAEEKLYRWGGKIFTSDVWTNYDDVPTNELQVFQGGDWVNVPTLNHRVAVHGACRPAWDSLSYRKRVSGATASDALGLVLGGLRPAPLPAFPDSTA
jgi:hypothetical protein